MCPKLSLSTIFFQNGETPGDLFGVLRSREVGKVSAEGRDSLIGTSGGGEGYFDRAGPIKKKSRNSICAKASRTKR